MTKEHREGISKGNKGKVGYWRGKKGPSPSNEARIRRNKLLIGNQYGIGNKSNSGRKFSEETKEKDRVRMLGNNYAKGGKSKTGIHPSEEQILKFKATIAKRKLNKTA